MSNEIKLENAVEELNQGAVEEIHSIEDIDAASDFELKHTPNVVIEELTSGQLVKVTIGLKGIAHPQQEDHLIQWIRVFAGSELVGEASFGSSDAPEASFEVARSSEQIIVQSLCNLHGIWEARI